MNYNKTKNQHFISRAEQELNTKNPSALSKNQKIYQFNIKNRERYQLSEPREVYIKNNLANIDLYSFKIEKDKRANFEDFFCKFESEIKIKTIDLLKKVEKGNENIEEELLTILKLKTLNTFRNPNSVKKTLNTFEDVIKFSPKEKELKELYKEIENTSNNFICKSYEITEKEYRDWLRIIFMLAIEIEKESIFEEIIQNLYLNKNFYTIINIHTYNEKTCLLSDRSFTTPLMPDSHKISWEFNLTSKAFIQYHFIHIDSVLSELSSQLQEERREMWEIYHKNKPKTIKTFHQKDNLDTLSNYNKRVITQSRKTCYNAERIPYIAEG